jgi:hypothetical protein
MTWRPALPKGRIISAVDEIRQEFFFLERAVL